MLLLHWIHPGRAALLPPRPVLVSPWHLELLGWDLGFPELLWICLPRISLDLGFPKFLWICLPSASLGLGFPELLGFWTSQNFSGFGLPIAQRNGWSWDRNGWIWTSQSFSGFGLPRTSLDLGFPELLWGWNPNKGGDFGFLVLLFTLEAGWAGMGCRGDKLDMAPRDGDFWDGKWIPVSPALPCPVLQVLSP